MSIRHYSGEYLVSPVPIHMGLNWCTHNCFYCFSNLNRPDRRADYDSIQQFIGKVQRKKPGRDIAAWLALQGHPIIASNDSDPFAKSNGQQNLALMHSMMDMGLRFSFQTRGGEGAVQMMEEHPPTMVYISFTTDQEKTRKQAEPGAPPFEARKELALAAKAAGHFVVAGINPFFPPWWDDIEGFVAWLAANDIRHVWTGEPHLNYMQVAAIPAKSKTAFADEIKFFSSKSDQLAQPIFGLITLCDAHDINVFEIGLSSSRGNFWQPYFDLGYPFWPTLDGLYSRLEQHGETIAFTFEAFDRWARKGMADFESAAFKEYCNGFGRSVRNVGIDLKATSLRQVHEWYWRFSEFPTPLVHTRFCLTTEDGDLATDSEGRFVLGYAPRDWRNTQRIALEDCDAVFGLSDENESTTKTQE